MSFSMLKTMMGTGFEPTFTPTCPSMVIDFNLTVKLCLTSRPINCKTFVRLVEVEVGFSLQALFLTCW